MGESRSVGLKWEHASLSDGIPNLAKGIYGVCFVMVAVHPGYSRLCKAEVGVVGQGQT